MKTASLSGSLLMRKGRAAPSLNNKQTQDYVEGKASMFASLTTGSGEDEEQEAFIPPEVDDNYLELPEQVLMSEEEIDAPIDSIVPVAEDDVIPDVPEKEEIIATKPETSGHRISTSLRLSEDRHLQLRLLAARQQRTIQSVLKDIVHEHLEADMKGLPCICKPDDH